jgi:hypothetical protein
VAAAFLLGGFMLGDTQAYRGRVDFLSVLTVPVALAGAVMVNPVGFKLYLVPFEIHSALRDLDAVNPEWLPVWSAPQPALFVGVAGLGVVVSWALVRARRIDAATALSTLALGVLAASGVRHQGLFVIGAAFLVGESMADIDRVPRRVARRSDAVPNAIAVGLCLVAALWCVWTPSSGPLRARQGPYAFGLGVQPGRYPVAAVEALETRPYMGPMYNDVAFGGYLAWRLYPRRVFIDGRNEVDADLLKQVVGARSDSRAWTALLDEFGIDRAMVRYDDRLIEVTDPSGNIVSRRTPNALLFPSSSFALVYWDDVSMVFVRRTEDNRERIHKDEYRFVHPEDRLRTLEAASTDPAFRDGVLAELERRLQQEPDCVRARALRNDLAGGSS